MLKSVKIGDVVRHPNPKFGVGEVTAVTNDNIEVRFSQRVVMLKAAVALPLLEPANRADLPAAKRARKSSRLASGKGCRFDRGVCTRCGLPAAPVWRYKDTHGGKVLLCSRCREGPLKRFRKKIDALSRSSGGAFESNRRRH